MTDQVRSSDWRDFTVPALSPLLSAALDCFVEHGYHGTSIREISSRANLSVPGIYHHYPSKHAILVDLMRFATTDLMVRSEAALQEATSDPLHRLRALIECLVLFHANRRRIGFLGATEIRSLENEYREEHVAARNAQQRLMDEIVESGIASGVFTTRYPRETSRAIITMCTSISQWFREHGSLSPDDLTPRYQAIAEAALRQTPAR